MAHTHTKTDRQIDSIKTKQNGAVEMAQRLRALTALPRVLSSNPSESQCSSQPPVMGSDTLFCVSEDSYSELIYKTKQTIKQNKKEKEKTQEPAASSI